MTSKDLIAELEFEWISTTKLLGLVPGDRLGWQPRHRVYRIDDLLKSGQNLLEIKVTTTMGNYMKTLKDNGVAQKWTNEKRQDQPIQSMGLLGPVRLYN